MSAKGDDLVHEQQENYPDDPFPGNKRTIRVVRKPRLTDGILDAISNALTDAEMMVSADGDAGNCASTFASVAVAIRWLKATREWKSESARSAAILNSEDLIAVLNDYSGGYSTEGYDVNSPISNPVVEAYRRICEAAKVKP